MLPIKSLFHAQKKRIDFYIYSPYSQKTRWGGTPTSPTSFDGLRLPVPSSEFSITILC